MTLISLHSIKPHSAEVINVSQGLVNKQRAVTQVGHQDLSTAAEYLHGEGLGPGSRNLFSDCETVQLRYSVNRYHRAMLWWCEVVEKQSEPMN